MKKLVIKEFVAWLDENSKSTVGMMGAYEGSQQDPLHTYMQENEVQRPATLPTWAKKFVKQCEAYPMYCRTSGYDAKMNLCDIIGYQYAF